jgi:peptide/nickel transport system substrate-binding protein
MGHPRPLRHTPVALIAVSAILFGACGSAATPRPTAPPSEPSTVPQTSAAPVTAPTTAAPSSAAPSARASTVPPATASAAPPASASVNAAAGSPGYSFDPSPVTGGTFTGAWVGPCCVGIANNNPLIASGDQHFLSKIFEPLVTYSIDPMTDGYGPIIGALAKSWETSGDGLIWTFHLQPGVKWQDGSPFTADDVIFTLTLCESVTVGCVYGGGIAGITGTADVKAGTATTVSGLAAPDPMTVTIHTDTPNAAMIDALSVMPIVQKASVSQIPLDQATKSPYWLAPNDATGKGGVQGTGPFFVAAYTTGQSMTLTANPLYWRGAPKLAKIVRQEFADPATALLAFDAGQIDFTYLTTNEVKRESANANARIIVGPSQLDNTVVFNPNANPAFANKLFRQAMEYAIDRKSIITNLYNGQGQALPCVFANPADISPSQNLYPYDPTMARALLAQAGVDMAKLPTFSFDTYFNDPISLDAMSAIQANWAAVGLKVNIDQMDQAAWANRYYTQGSSQISFIGARNGPDPSIASTYFLSTAQYQTGAGGNGWKGYFYSNPQVDSLLKQGISTFDPAGRATIYRELCSVLADDMPWNILWQTTRAWIVNKKIGNFFLTPAPGGGSYYDAAEQWYVKS